MKYVIGIDLHGTLLDDKWKIKEKSRDMLIGLLKNKEIYVCTGNDLTFIHKYVPKEISSLLRGFVLETGCVVSDGKKEEIIVLRKQIQMIKELEKQLKKQNFKEVLYFARRLATISMFTKSEFEGVQPDFFFIKIKEFIEKSDFRNKVLVTHSNVAVDIIPKGHNKFSGMEHIAKEKEIVGIADSLNDFHLINDADYGFIPKNASERLIRKLKENKKEIINITKAVLKKGQVVISNKKNAGFVVECLKFLENGKI
jgi:hydroxymethylpyrimidine pyrophosphatase-like HAD family hydrolase